MGHNASKPAVTKPTDSTKPVDTKHTDSAKHVESPKVVEATKPVDTKPVESVKPVEPVKPVESKPAAPVKAAAPAKQTSPAKKVDALTNFTPKYDTIKKLDDAHYGEVGLVKEHETGRQMILKRVVANTKEGYEAELLVCKQRAAFKNNNVVQVIGYQHEEKKSFCSNFHNIDIFIEPFEKTLADKINEVKVNQIFFSEDEILFIAENLISCLAYFQVNGVHHGDIRPANIFVAPNCYKLSDPTLAAQKNYNAYYAALFEGKKTLLAPEFLKKLAEKEVTIQIGSKFDAFSLGATLLALATLTDSEDLYNYERGVINDILFAERLDKLKTRYSQFTYELIRDLLHPEEEKRVDFVTLEARLSPYKQQITSRIPLSAKVIYEDDDILKRVAEQLARSQELRASIEKGTLYHSEVVSHENNGRVLY